MHAQVTCPLLKALALVVGCTYFDAAPATSECAPVTGAFFISGVAQEHGLPSQMRVRYGSVDGAATDAHYFHYMLDPASGTVASTFFNEAGKQIRHEARASEYSCKSGVLVRESETRGYSEGCSKTGRSRSAVSVGTDGSLVFSTREQWEFGLLCFAKPREAQRVVSFPRYEASAK